MADPIEHGEWIEMPDGSWRVARSTPIGRVYQWRDGSKRTVPELIDPAVEKQVRHAPPVSLDDDDPPLRFAIVSWPL